MSELALTWYSYLNSLNTALYPLITSLLERSEVPVLVSLALGLLAAVSPCQLTTNLTALAYLGQRGGHNLDGIGAYLLAKVLVYSALGGAALVLGAQVAPALIPGAVVARKVLGPLMILVGLFLLGILQWNIAPGGGIGRWLEGHTQGAGTWGPFLLGLAFSFAFCPTLLWLFFGLLIPLSLATATGPFLPGVFAVGTGLPLLLLFPLSAFRAGGQRALVQGVAKWEWWARWAVGGLVILAGLNDTLVYWFL